MSRGVRIEIETDRCESNVSEIINLVSLFVWLHLISVSVHVERCHASDELSIFIRLSCMGLQRRAASKCPDKRRVTSGQLHE